jgi:DNA processing protein
VLAVPGEITSALSAGTNALLRLGAAPVTRVEDVLELFDLPVQRADPARVGAVAEALLERLRDGALTADELVRSSGVEAGQAAAALVELELARCVELDDGVYRVTV